MRLFRRIVAESVAQAFQQLWSNRLRTFLSLLGVIIGIVCVIGVLSAVDSLEANIRASFDKLGDDVLYVQKIAWGEDPGQNYYKYLRRPRISYQDFEAVSSHAPSAGLVSYHVFIGPKTVRFRANSVENAFLFGITYDYGEMFKLDLAKGRYFSSLESQTGSNRVILGAEVAEELFGNIEPVGKTIRIGGRNLEVIGVLEKSGNSVINIMNFDQAALITYELAQKMANLKSNSLFGNSSLNVKAGEGVNLEEVEGEVIMALRAERRLKPREEANFSINRLSILSDLLSSFFGVLNVVGLFIGGFSIFVGMFSVANIMFVSVKERTGIIGVKKALGAKRYVILLEFLVESVVLCVVGGIIGLGIVQILVVLLSAVLDFEFQLSWANIGAGILLSAIVGVLAGIIPASQAARMDPVEAMRQ